MLDASMETNFNLSLIDPAKWGWSAGGKVVQLLTPHEVCERVLVFPTLNVLYYTGVSSCAFTVRGFIALPRVVALTCRLLSFSHSHMYHPPSLLLLLRLL